MFKSLQIKLLKRVIKNEVSYLLSSTIVFISLFFILFVLFLGKEIFIHYSDTKSMLLPQSMLYVEKELGDVYKTLSKNGISKKDVLVARVKNYKDLSIYSNINGGKSLPKHFTLLSFDIETKRILTLECSNIKQEVELKGLGLKQRKNWVFKTQKLEKCPLKSRVKLTTESGEVELTLQRNSKWATLIYKSDKRSDKIFYPYLIKLEESFFMNYFAYSKFFVDTKKLLTKETQEHSKMLHSLFRLIFAQTKQKCMLNHEAYSFLTEYKKIPFSILPISDEYTKSMTVVDELPLNIKNDLVLFYSNLIITNLNSVQNIDYDGTLLFFKEKTPSKSLFKDAITIEREAFLTVQESRSFEINIIIYTTTFILFILMLALIKSFISRTYKRYYDRFALLIFYGFRVKIVTLLFTFSLMVSVVFSYILTELLFTQVNQIFNLYYVDLMNLDFEYSYITVFFLLSIVFSYFDETKRQENIANKTKR